MNCDRTPTTRTATHRPFQMETARPGNRTQNLLIKSQQTADAGNSRNSLPPNELQPNLTESGPQRAAPGAARSAADADLDRLFAAWPMLTAETRAEILAIVELYLNTHCQRGP